MIFREKSNFGTHKNKFFKDSRLERKVKQQQSGQLLKLEKVLQVEQ
jgi:hypothetical protein